jgi:hypothetical protein
VGKINYASSMQSHKMGACNLYNDLYKTCVSNSITDFTKNERVTVKEEPFLYFVQETEGSNDNLKVFHGLMTYGPGKADKPTWGVDDEDLMAGDSMLEGADNNNPLTDMRVPWTDAGTDYEDAVIYDADKESFMYDGATNLDFDFGDTEDLHADDAEEVPTNAQVKLWQPIFNFLYLTNTTIKPWEGSLATLNTAAESSDFAYKYAYWIPTTINNETKYYLYRCAYKTVNNIPIRTFVPAGIRLVHTARGVVTTYINFDCLSDTRDFYNSADKWYSVDASNNPINLDLNDVLTLAGTYANTTITIPTGSNYNKMNVIFKNALAIIFRHYVEQNLYLNKSSNLFHHEFMKLDAGTDNRSKNTYYRYNIAYKNMEMHADDLDTIFKTNNIGYQYKPYYILEHDADENGSYYWEGQFNVLNNTLESAYSPALIKEEATVSSLTDFSEITGHQKDMKDMMLSMFNAMINLVKINDTLPDGTVLTQTVEDCMMKYFMSISQYFPAVAFNETAKWRYESATVFADRPRAIYQSLGNQYDSEVEYIRKRMIFLSGYARHKTLTGALQNRGRGGEYEMHLVPHYWLYPTAMSGASLDAGTVLEYGDRVAAGASTDAWTITTTGDTTFTLFNATNMRELGNIRKWPTGNAGSTGNADLALSIVSKRLIKLEIYRNDDEDESVMKFNASTLSIAQCTNLERIDIHNASRISAFENGLSNLIRLKYLDCRGTGITNILLPQTTSLKTVYFPAGMTAISINNCPNITTFDLQGYSSLTSISIPQATLFNTYTLIENCYNNNAPLISVILRSINWTNVSVDVLSWLLTIDNLNLTGTIAMDYTNPTKNITFDLKRQLINKFGNIDSPSNPLYITYTQIEPPETGGFYVTGTLYVRAAGSYPFNIKAGNKFYNTVKAISWDYVEVENASNATFMVNSRTGVLTVTSLASSTCIISMRCTLTFNDNTTRIVTRNVYLWNREAQVGDYVYADGEYSASNVLDEYKTVIGVCCFIGNAANGDYNLKDTQYRLAVSTEDLSNNITSCWSPYIETDFVNPTGFPNTFELYKCEVVDNQAAYTPLTFVENTSDFYNTPMPDYNIYGNLPAGGYYNKSGSSAEYTVDHFALVSPNYAYGNGFSMAKSTESSYIIDKTRRTLGQDLFDLAGDVFKKTYGEWSETQQKYIIKTVNHDLTSIEIATYEAQGYSYNTFDKKLYPIVNAGYYETLEIIKYRNTIIMDASKEGSVLAGISGLLRIPSATKYKKEMTVLSEILSSMRDDYINEVWTGEGENRISSSLIRNTFNEPETIANTGLAKYLQLMCPAASTAYAYQPAVKDGEILNDKFKSHNWFLPSSGMLYRIYKYYQNAENTPDNIFQAAITADKFIDFSNTFSDIKNPYYCSSTEIRDEFCWMVNFRTDILNNIYKYTTCNLRALVAF